MNTQTYSDQTTPRARLGWLMAGIGLFGIVFSIRLFQIQILQHDKYLALGVNIHQRKYEVPAMRGEIYMRDHDKSSPLVLNQTLKLLYADPSFIGDKVKTARTLAEATGGNATKYYDLLGKGGEYVVLESKITSDAATKIGAMNLAGIGMVDQSFRVYPEGALASQVTGFLNADGLGQYGLEGYLNTDLTGKPGLLKAKTDTRGIPIATADNFLKPPVDGSSYEITIDRNIQSQTEKFLKSGVEAVGAKSGSVVIMDPSTGAVLAMANYPSFDPNEYTKVTDYNLFSNSVVSDNFEPGSGFKAFTMAAGLDSGRVKVATTYNDTGTEEVSGRVIHNAEDHKFGIQTMTDIIQKSLNTGVIFVLKSLGSDPTRITEAGKKLYYDYLTKRFGFGVRTGIEVAGEASGAVNAPSSPDVNYANMSFGQGISVTMLQMVSAMSAVANGGKLYQPYIIDKILKPDGSIINHQPHLVNPQVISKQAATDLVQMLVQVVEHGSGYLAKVPGYRIAGKTGTAQIPRADGLGYVEGKNIGSFIGLAPVENPRFVMMVRINEPKTAGFAESTTVPVFANISQWLLRYYAIPPSI